MPRIACLHTADSNIAVFDEASRSLGLAGIRLHHAVRADLLAAAERAGGLTPAIAAETAALLRDLTAGADAVLLTCSTLGPAAEAASPDAAVPVLRVDAALAAEAVKAGGRVVVLCAVETTVAPTRCLFEAAARATGAEIDVAVVPQAWEAFKAGESDRYRNLVAPRRRRHGRTARHGSPWRRPRWPAPPPCFPRDSRPLTSPAASLAAAIAAARRHRPGPG